MVAFEFEPDGGEEQGWEEGLESEADWLDEFVLWDEIVEESAGSDGGKGGEGYPLDLVFGDDGEGDDECGPEGEELPGVGAGLVDLAENGEEDADEDAGGEEECLGEDGAFGGDGGAKCAGNESDLDGAEFGEFGEGVPVVGEEEDDGGKGEDGAEEEEDDVEERCTVVGELCGMRRGHVALGGWVGLG